MPSRLGEVVMEAASPPFDEPVAPALIAAPRPRSLRLRRRAAWLAVDAVATAACVALVITALT
jgi:hypothetical protein